MSVWCACILLCVMAGLGGVFLWAELATAYYHRPVPSLQLESKSGDGGIWEECQGRRACQGVGNLGTCLGEICSAIINVFDLTEKRTHGNRSGRRNSPCRALMRAPVR